MKRTLYMILAIINFGIYLNAQDCSETINTEPGTTKEVYDWRQTHYDVVLGVVGDAEELMIESPYFNGDDLNNNIYHINNPALKDFQDSEGWELVTKRFGASDDPVGRPFLVTYNRYEGVLRVLVWIRQGVAGYNSANLTLLFNDNEAYQSAALSLINTPTTALDSWLRDIKMHTPNSYVNQEGAGFWLFADYPIAYDPCTCNNSSTLQVLAELINVSTITLEMEGGGTIEQILDTGNSTPSLSKIANEAIENGTKVSKSLAGYVTTAGKIHANYKLKIAKEDGTIENYDDLSDADKKKEDKKFTDNVTLPAWVKAIPKIGFVLGVAEQLIGGGKTTPPKPISFDANLKFDITGTDETVHEYGGIDIYTPGSIWGGNSDREPVYNNIMGVFNILRTPEFEKAWGNETWSAGFPGGGGIGVELDQFRMRMTNDLEYVINPAAGLKLVDIKAAIVVDGGESSEELFSYDVVELASPNPEPPLDEYVPSTMILLEGEDGRKRYQSPFYPISCLSDIVIKSGGFYYDPVPELSSYDDIRLKVMVTLERDTSDLFYDEDAEMVIFMIEYSCNTTDVDIALIPSMNSYDEIDFSETVSDISLTTGQTIYAWSSIEVGENIVTNGNQLTLIAGGEITGNIADLPPNVDLIIGYPPLCDEPIPAAVSGSDLNAFCNGGGYSPTGQIINDPESRVDLMEEESNQTTFDLVVSPNPFNNFIDLQYSNYELQGAEIIVTDLLGRTITYFESDLSIGGNQKMRIETFDWQSGIYMLTLKTDDFIKTIKLIKQ